MVIRPFLSKFGAVFLSMRSQFVHEAPVICLAHARIFADLVIALLWIPIPCSLLGATISTVVESK